jgi:hypothetical protein
MPLFEKHNKKTPAMLISIDHKLFGLQSRVLEYII